ncbi:RluA family pseudouridine synthase [Colwellia sp. RE-S-Sl-9]
MNTSDNIIFEKHLIVTTEASNALIELDAVCNISIADIKKAIAKGALWLTRGKSTQRFRRLKKTLKKGDELHFYYNEGVLKQEPNEAILIEDMGDYSVWYKPYGMLSQGSKWSDHCTIARWAQTHLQPERPVFIVHRLDRAATGLIVIAHTKKMAQAFSQKFEHHQLEKHYLILVHGDHNQRSQPDNISIDVDGKKALSTFTCIDYNRNIDVSLVNVKIESGRKHQIRIHSASIDMPVVGDRLHGIKEKDDVLEEKIKKNIDLQLCAFSLSFDCPFGEINTTPEHKTFSLPEHLRPSLAALTI